MLKQRLNEFLNVRKEERIYKRRKKQYIEDIISGRTLLIIDESKIAEVILQWCDKEENPVQYFLHCLAKIGVEAPVKITNLKEAPEYYSTVMIEAQTQKERILNISKTLKELLVMAAPERIRYNLQENRLTIKENGVKIKYWEEKMIGISLENNISIFLSGINWNKDEDLYDKAQKLLKDLRSIHEDSGFYEYYTKVKENIQKYYNLEGVEIDLSNEFWAIKTRDGEIISYKDSINGIAIQRGKGGWSHKEYRKGKVLLAWECNRFKCEGVTNKDIQKYVDIAEKAIEEVEKLKY